MARKPFLLMANAEVRPYLNLEGEEPILDMPAREFWTTECACDVLVVDALPFETLEHLCYWLNAWWKGPPAEKPRLCALVPPDVILDPGQLELAQQTWGAPVMFCNQPTTWRTAIGFEEAVADPQLGLPPLPPGPGEDGAMGATFGAAASPSPGGSRPETAQRDRGPRLLGVWSFQGGSGQSTFVRALAHSLAQQGRGKCRVVIASLAFADPLPMRCGVKPEPNINDWITGLQPDLQSCLQFPSGRLGIGVVCGLRGPDQQPRALPLLLEQLPRLRQEVAATGAAWLLLDTAPVFYEAVLPHMDSSVFLSTASANGALAAVAAGLWHRHTIPETPVYWLLTHCTPQTNPAQYRQHMAHNAQNSFRNLEPALLLEDPAVRQAELEGLDPWLRSQLLHQAAEQLASQCQHINMRPTLGAYQ